MEKFDGQCTRRPPASAALRKPSDEACTAATLCTLPCINLCSSVVTIPVYIYALEVDSSEIGRKTL